MPYKLQHIFCLGKVRSGLQALLVITVILFGVNKNAYSQCKNHFTLQTNHICNGADTLHISSFDTLSQIQWFTGTALDTIVNAVSIPSVLDVKTVAGGNGKGIGLNQLNNPYGIFIDKSGYLYVVDQNNNRILKYPPGSTSLTNGVVVAGSNPNGGSGPSEFNFPMSVFVDEAGNIFVADFNNGRIQKFPPNSTAATSGVTVAKYGLDGPSYVALDASGNLFVADEAEEDILKYPPNSTPLSVPDTLGTGLGYVISLFVATNGDLYAALADFSCVIKFPARSSNAVLVAGGNGNGNALNQLPAPTSCYVDTAGYLYVLDGVTCITLRFPPNSTGSSYGTIVAGGNGVRGGSAANALQNPSSLFLDNAGNIYVADDGNNRVVQYFKDGPRTTFIDSVYGPQTAGLQNPITYYAIVTNIDGCTDTTNTITILPTHLPSITINSDATDPNLCGHFTEPLTFTASITNGGTAPAFLWHLNGLQVGSNGPTYSGVFSNGDVVNCELTSNVNCVVIPTIESTDFIVHFHTPPSASLILKGGNCPGNDTLIINPDINSISTVNWVNGQIIDTIFKSRQVLDTGIRSIGITVAGGNGGGNSNNQLNEPSSVCVDANGNIYVADTYNNRILFFPKGSNSFTNGIVVAGGNGNGFNPNQLSSPTSVCIDAQGNLYVADADNYRIQKFPPGSNSSTNGITVAGGNSIGTALNQISDPVSVDVDGAGNIFVCDALNNRVVEFPPNSTNQNFGLLVGMVTNAFSMYVTPSGSVYVSDFQNDKVILLPGGKTVLDGGQTSPAFVPYGLFVDNYNNIFIADGRNDQVLEFSGGSTKGVVVAGAAGKGNANNQLNEPYSICGDDSSNLFVADFANNRIEKYKHFITVIDTVFYPKTPGVYYAVLTDTSGCTFNTDTITILKPVVPRVKITTPADTICYGTPVTFTAIIADSTSPLNFLWKINNDSAGTNNNKFTTNSLTTSDSVSCIISTINGCTLASDTSNIISLIVNPIPILGPADSLITIQFGSSMQLTIPVQGDVSSYTWTPDYYLSADNIPSVVASPHRSTVYYLTVVSATDGCPATDSITVNVISKIHIPNAFSPNGDGKNDVFYIMGGLPGDVIKDFTIFNRWGYKVFQNQNGIPNYTSYGWDGNINESPAPTGSYVYVVTIKSLNGEQAVYKGTVVLIR